MEINKLSLIGKCIIINSSKEILILKRTNYKNNGSENLWDIPGGNVEKDECINNGIKREVFEETNLSLENNNIFYIDSGKKYENGQFVFTLFYSKNFQGELKLSHEHSEYRWINYQDLDNFDFHLREGKIELIKNFLKNNLF